MAKLELYLLVVLAVGLVIGIAGYLWLLTRAFRVRVLWGLGLLFPPLALVFVPLHWRKAVGPLVVLLLAAVVVAVPFGVNYYFERYVDLGPRERLVDGELHITLTGWDGDDYSVLKARPQTVVLQMANPDVDDQTLQYLRAMNQLRELDLNDSQVTDQGLAVLSGLPRLEALRLRNTKITDDGFRAFLNPLDALRELDLRGTKVAAETVRAWRAAQPGRRALR
jgi:hypothetical protein